MGSFFQPLILDLFTFPYSVNRIIWSYDTPLTPGAKTFQPFPFLNFNPPPLLGNCNTRPVNKFNNSGIPIDSASVTKNPPSCSLFNFSCRGEPVIHAFVHYACAVLLKYQMVLCIASFLAEQLCYLQIIYLFLVMLVIYALLYI